MTIFVSSLRNGLRVIAIKFMKYNCHGAGKHQPLHILQANKLHFDRKSVYYPNHLTSDGGHGERALLRQLLPSLRGKLPPERRWSRGLF